MSRWSTDWTAEKFDRRSRQGSMKQREVQRMRECAEDAAWRINFAEDDKRLTSSRSKPDDDDDNDGDENQNADEKDKGVERGDPTSDFAFFSPSFCFASFPLLLEYQERKFIFIRNNGNYIVNS